MKKKTIGIIAGVTAGAAVTAFGGISYHMMASATGGHRQTYGEALAWQKEHYDTAFFDGLAKEDYTVVSEDGYVLHALFVKNPADTDRYVILTHGYTDNRYGTLKYMKIYLDLGFNCICYDLRGHGENAPATTPAATARPNKKARSKRPGPQNPICDQLIFFCRSLQLRRSPGKPCSTRK